MTRRTETSPDRVTMRVIMTKSMPGSEDGIRVQRYDEGETYEMGQALATSFLNSKCAKPAPKPEPQKEPDGGNDHKGGKGPDENK